MRGERYARRGVGFGGRVGGAGLDAEEGGGGLAGVVVVFGAAGDLLLEGVNSLQAGVGEEDLLSGGAEGLQQREFFAHGGVGEPGEEVVDGQAQDLENVGEAFVGGKEVDEEFVGGFGVHA